jgi:hypothetical protein
MMKMDRIRTVGHCRETHVMESSSSSPSSSLVEALRRDRSSSKQPQSL